MPSNQSFVSVVGMLTDVTFIHGDQHQRIKHFHLMVQSILSLNQTPLVPKGFFKQAGIDSGQTGKPPSTLQL